MSAMRISDLAKAGGVGLETVRFYQRKGLLATPRGDGAAGRHYGPDDARRLNFVRRAQTAGFTLAEIGELIELDRSDDRPRAREMASQRIAALNAEIVRLEQARQSLDKLARDCARGGSGPCPILAAFD